MTFPLHRHFFNTGPLFSITFPRRPVIFKVSTVAGGADIVLYVVDRKEAKIGQRWDALTVMLRVFVGGAYINDNICATRDPLARLLTPCIFNNIPGLDS
jgi:hypothetical protein